MRNPIIEKPLHSRESYADIRSDIVLIEGHKWIELSTKSKNSNLKAIIIYPGFLIDSYAYVHKFQDLVTKNRKVFIVKPLLGVIKLEANIGIKVIKSNPNIKKWIIIGHSWGGEAAAQHVVKYPSYYEQLIQLGSYAKNNLKFLNIPISVVEATRDGDTPPSLRSKYIQNYPSQVAFFTFQGANHADFTDILGNIPRDNPSSISPKQAKLKLMTILKRIILE